MAIQGNFMTRMLQRRNYNNGIMKIRNLALFCLSVPALAQTNTKALVGGTLIDGFGGPTLANSVILIEGARITKIGQVGQLAIPAGAEVISTEGMTVLPGLWDVHVHLMIDGHADYEHWDKTYPPQMESVIMPASAKQLLLAGVTSARDLGGPLSPGHSSSTRRIPGLIIFAGA
jgi:imidazolonepropionase-like amidohydrolase